jgi:hypothetical protein
MRIEGDFEHNVILGWYKEPDQPPPQIRATAKTLWLSPMGGNPVMFDGAPYRGVLAADAAGFRTYGSLHVGSAETGSPVSACTFRVDGDAYLTRDPSVVFDPTFYINTTNAYSTIDFQRQGASCARIQYAHPDGSLYYMALNAGSHRFYSNGEYVAQVSGAGLDLKVGNALSVAGTQVVGAQGAPVANATDSASAITQLNALLARCRAHGLIAP